MTGVDANYSLDMEKAGKTWSEGNTPGDLFAILHSAGVDSFRVRLWTGDDGLNGLEYATTIAKRAQAAGSKPYLVIFLSENWSDLVKQPLPAVWKDVDEPAKLAAIETYAERVTKHFIDAGINIELFEIGNEIDFGICGVFEEAWPNRVSVEYMRAKIWPRMIPIINAAQRGVKKAQPNAKFILHLAQWAKADWCTAFWQTMLAGGVQLDYPGLSYFPTSANDEKTRPLAFLHTQVDTIYAALKKPVVICESGYPSAATFPGQFADWNKPVPGFTLDPAGQQKWVADYLASARANEHLAGAFYWSPEWYASDLWSEFALFDSAGKAKPAMKSLAPAVTGPATQPSGAVNEDTKPCIGISSWLRCFVFNCLLGSDLGALGVLAFV